MKESFLLYFSLYEPLKKLSLKNKGIFLDAIFQFNINGTVDVNLPPVVDMAFQFAKSQFLRDNIKYEEIRKRNITNGIKGGRPKLKTNKPFNPVGLLGSQFIPVDPTGNPDKPKKAVSVSVYDNIYVAFATFIKLYPGTKRGLKTELENLLKKNKPEIVDLLLPALEREKAYKAKCLAVSSFVAPWKNLSTWINQKCWEQEFTEPEIPKQPNGKAVSIPITTPMIDPEVLKRINVKPV